MMGNLHLVAETTAAATAGAADVAAAADAAASVTITLPSTGMNAQ